MSATQAPGYFPRLDALRAIAVTLVVVSHWLPQSTLARALPVGTIGVVAFFVLSGFLITHLLLAERPPGEAMHGREGRRALRDFYMRRTLRIFPAYYALLLALWLAGVPSYRDDIGWYAGYATNILIFDAQAWIGPAPHLWTLAVEEQFYLLWPLGALFLPRRALAPVLLIAIASGPLSRLLLVANGDGSTNSADFAEVLMPSCMDSFALGGLLAWWRTRTQPTPMAWRWAWRAFVIACAVATWSMRDAYGLVPSMLFRFTLSIVALAVVAWASAPVPSRFGRWMEHPVPVGIGRISYGLYLYHPFAPPIAVALGIVMARHTAAAFAVHALLLLAVAGVSWFALERPLLRLKSRFARRAEARPVAATSPA